MNSILKVKRTHLLCGMVVFLALVSGQSGKLFGISGGTLYQLLFFSKYIATAGLTAYALSVRRKVLDSEVKKMFKIFSLLIVLMVITEIIAAVKSPVPAMFGVKYWTRSLFVFLDRICIYVLVADIWTLCEKKAVDCLTFTFLIDELLVFVSAIFKVGPVGILNSFLNAFALKEGSSNYFEVHELTFCMGLCIIYYLFFDEKKKNKIGRICLLIVGFILGAKRIGLAGIAAAGLFSLFIHKKGLTRRKLVITGTIGIVICFLYLFIIYNNEFFVLLNQYGINNMGRDLIYAYFTRRTKLDMSQIGWGMAGVAKVVENMDRSEVLYMAAVRGLHNDIMKIYINFGFGGSLLWYAFNLLYVPIKFFERYGKKVATIYMSLILYMFVTYCTDNTEGYFVCQVALILIPITEYLKENHRKD